MRPTGRRSAYRESPLNHVQGSAIAGISDYGLPSAASSCPRHDQERRDLVWLIDRDGKTGFPPCLVTGHHPSHSTPTYDKIPWRERSSRPSRPSKSCSPYTRLHVLACDLRPAAFELLAQRKMHGGYEKTNRIQFDEAVDKKWPPPALTTL